MKYSVQYQIFHFFLQRSEVFNIFILLNGIVEKEIHRYLF